MVDVLYEWAYKAVAGIIDTKEGKMGGNEVNFRLLKSGLNPVRVSELVQYYKDEIHFRDTWDKYYISMVPDLTGDGIPDFIEVMRETEVDEYLLQYDNCFKDEYRVHYDKCYNDYYKSEDDGDYYKKCFGKESMKYENCFMRGGSENKECSNPEISRYKECFEKDSVAGLKQYIKCNVDKNCKAKVTISVYPGSEGKDEIEWNKDSKIELHSVDDTWRLQTEYFLSYLDSNYMIYPKIAHIEVADYNNDLINDISFYVYVGDRNYQQYLLLSH